MTDTASPLSTAAPRGKGSLILLGLFTLVGVAVLIGLGCWQVERLGAKNRLLARVEQRVNAAPADLPPVQEWPYMKPKAYEYAKVRARGTFLHDKEVHVYGLKSGGNGRDPVAGYYILTPLALQDGSGTVIVNRGFVPAGREDSKTRPEGQLAGEQSVVGLLRAPEARGLFTPDDDPAKNIWFTRDPASIAKAEGLEHVAPFSIDADGTPVPGGLPQGGNTVLSFPNNHLQYALTWFTLAIALVAVYVAYWRSRTRPAARERG